MTNPNEDSFQITLPSNSCSKLYPRNRPNSYKTQLCNELDLPTGEWEMALVDIQYPIHWPNLMESTDLAFIVEPDPSLRSKDKNFSPIGINIDMSMFEGALIGGTSYDPYFGWNYKRQTSIPSGHYRSIQEVGKMIENLFRDLMQPELEEVTGKRFAIEYSFDRSTGLSQFAPIGPGRIHLSVTNRYLLETIFAFPESHLRQNNDTAYPSLISYRLPLQSSRHSALELLSSMYVYSSLAEYQIVGDTVAPLLGIVPIQPLLTSASKASASSAEQDWHPDDQQFYSFNPPYYIPLKISRFKTIEVQLNTDWGAPFPFSDDPNNRVCCRLHFRKRKSPTGPRILL